MVVASSLCLAAMVVCASVLASSAAFMASFTAASTSTAGVARVIVTFCGVPGLAAARALICSCTAAPFAFQVSTSARHLAWSAAAASSCFCASASSLVATASDRPSAL
ncbi:hypothetical protein D9M68_989880 [compost metagenome]